MAVHVLGGWAREIGNGCGDVFRPAKATCGDALEIPGARSGVRGEVRGAQACLHRTRADGVDTDAVRGPLGREMACHARDRRLRNAIGGHARYPDDGERRCDIDDCPAPRMAYELPCETLGHE